MRQADSALRLIVAVGLIAVALCSRLTAADPCYVLRSEPQQHHFALVIDRSGSMSGEPLEEAIAGARSFVRSMRPGDRAAVFAFDDRVEEVQKLTGDRRRLLEAIGSIRPGGQTALYDALARAAGSLRSVEGMRVVLFLTDGVDTRSRYSLDDVVQQCSAEGVFVYGIGLGDVDRSALEQLSQATGGGLEVGSQVRDVRALYGRISTRYYEEVATGLASRGAFSIRSLPKGREVRVDGKFLGKTPLKLDGWPPGQHAVEVLFKRGVWKCQAEAAPLHRTLIDARDADLGFDLWVVSRPHDAAVYIDGAYVGTTAMRVVDTRRKNWSRRVMKDQQQLRVPLVPPGRHKVRLLALTELDFGPEQEMSFEIEIREEERVVLVDLLRGRAQFGDGSVVERSTRAKIDDVFDELDQMIDD